MITRRYEFIVETPIIDTVTTEEGLLVTMTTATEGATIHYTRGENPTASSPLYTGPFVTTNLTAAIRAIAVKPGWTNSSIRTIAFIPSVSISDSEALSSQVNIFPNPTRDYVNIEYDGTAKVFLYTISGMLLYERTFTGNKKVSLEAFPSGLYLLKIVSERGVLTQQIIKN